MDARTGKKIRLGRIFDRNSGKAIVVAYSHGLLLGPLPGLMTLEQQREVSHKLRDANAIMIAPGMVDKLEDAFVGRDRPSLVLHLDWSNFSRPILPVDFGAQHALATIEEAAATGADAVMTYLMLSGDPQLERMEIERNARVARECERAGMVLMIEPRLAMEKSRPDIRVDPAIMKLYCRISAEVGADIVKCIWSESVETMHDIVATCPAPVLMAGGPKKDTVAEAIKMAQQAMEAGCQGLVFGRNVYQSPDPASVLAALREVVHGGGRKD